MDIKPIETVYNGYRFRSRLEARWAVFFDAAGINYQYEPEGFEFQDGTKYLPDFYIPSWDTYVEIKPITGNVFNEKAFNLACGLRKNVVLFAGEPFAQHESCGPLIRSQYTTSIYTANGDIGFWAYDDAQDTGPYTIRRCRNCNAFVISDNFSPILHFGVETGNRCWERAGVGDKIIDKAYLAARQARFEHGEKPRVGARA